MTREEFWTNVYFQHIEKDFPEALADLALAEYDRRFGEKKPVAEEDNEGWIPWEGGECPVDSDTLVDVKFRNGSVWGGLDPEGMFWEHREHSGDIFAYRIHKD